MNQTERWLLPEGIDEVMPEQAAQVESLRRQLIDRMQSWGYKLVFPPLVEYLDSLLTGTAKTLDIQTFKLTDQMSGRLMGIRADITPQVARIAAHTLRNEEQVQRLCYIGNVLQTLPQSQGSSRNPIQVGAEIYGHSGPESDLEIIQLMVEMLAITGFESDLLLDIGHVGIYRGLAQQTGLTTEQEQALFEALQRKAAAEINELLVSFDIEDKHREMLGELAELNGNQSVLDKAVSAFADADESVKQALATLQTVSSLLSERLPSVSLNFDLAELRGYNYHTGLVFSAYQSGQAQALAMGGRYDDIGEDFGHAQPATGFSLDLKMLAAQGYAKAKAKKQPIIAPWSGEAEQQALVERLRREGEVVIYQLEEVDQVERRIEKQNGHWLVVETGTQTRG